MITLTLTFLPTTEGAIVRWDADVIGTRQSALRSPLVGKDLEIVLRALDVLQDPDYPLPWTEIQQRYFAFDADQRLRLKRLGLWDDLGRVSLDAPQRVGRLLFAALTADRMGAQALGTCRDHATALGEVLELILRFPPGSVGVAALPWELLWDDGPTPLLLSRGLGGSCTRHLDLPQALPPPQRTEGALRILALTPHAALSPELRQIERAAREEAWGDLIKRNHATVHELSPVTRQGLVAAIRDIKPDIIHFFGHGRYNDGGGALLLDTLDEGVAWLNASALAALCKGVSLVALHACRGGVMGSEAGDLLTGVAPALSAAGVPLVLAMQFTIRSEAAARICASIYSQLATGNSAQSALTDARRVLFVEESDQVSWFVPVLYVRSRDLAPAHLRPSATNNATVLAEVSPSSQLISATNGSSISNIEMQGNGSTRQAIVARAGSVINAVRLYIGGAK